MGTRLLSLSSTAARRWKYGYLAPLLVTMEAQLLVCLSYGGMRVLTQTDAARCVLRLAGEMTAHRFVQKPISVDSNAEDTYS